MTETTRTARANTTGLLDPAKVTSRRVELGLLQKEVAKRAGISPQMMADVETGRRHGAPPTRLAIAKALRTRLADLVRETP